MIDIFSYANRYNSFLKSYYNEKQSIFRSRILSTCIIWEIKFIINAYKIILFMVTLYSGVNYAGGGQSPLHLPSTLACFRTHQQIDLKYSTNYSKTSLFCFVAVFSYCSWCLNSGKVWWWTSYRTARLLKRVVRELNLGFFWSNFNLT